jgi:type IV pilus assembly protein PilN
MYSLDVNFLKDRGVQSEPGLNKPKPTPKGSMTPLYMGVGVGLFFPAVVLGLLFFLQQQTAQLQGRSQELDQKLGELKQAENKIAQLEQEITRVNDETTALAGVFNQIKPWSALLQDIREDIPPGVQIKTIQQTEVVAKAPPAAASAPKAKPAAKGANAKAANAPAEPQKLMQMQISGTARSFDDVGYFLMTLKQSPFLKTDETQLAKAQLIANPTGLEVPESKLRSAVRQTYELPKVVEYTIQTTLSDVPASEIVRELDRKGAVGLVTRIRTLQQIQEKGATPGVTPGVNQGATPGVTPGVNQGATPGATQRATPGVNQRTTQGANQQ